MVVVLLMVVGFAHSYSRHFTVVGSWSPDMTGWPHAAVDDTLDIEELMGELDESVADYAYRREWIEELLEHPLDLNRVSVEELIDVPFLSAADAMSIITHRVERGPFSSADSLGSIKGLDPLVATRLRPFVYVRPENGGRPHASVDSVEIDSTSLRLDMDLKAPGSTAQRRRRSLHADVMQRWTRKLELADGFRRDSSGYLGNPNVLQTRLRFQIGHFSTGVTFDKDSGEPMKWEPGAARFGYDFAAGNLAITDAGWIQRLVIGDYSVRFAFGNMLRSPGSVRSSIPSPAIRGSTVRPFASSAETGHFRGMAIELEPYPFLSISGFVSRRKYDARIDSSSTIHEPIMLRRSTGLHRTATENAGRNALTETAAGGSARVAVGPLLIAGMAYVFEDQLDPHRIPGAPDMRRLTRAASFATSVTFRSVHVSMELTPRGGVAAAADFRAVPFAVARLRYRRSSAQAYLPHSSYSSGSSGTIDPTRQAALQVRIHPSRHTSVDFSLQHVRRGAGSGQRPFASTRTAGSVELRHEFRPWFDAALRVTHRSTEESASCSRTRTPDRAVRCLVAMRHRSARIQIDYRHSRSIESRSRIEVVVADSDRPRPSRGALLYHDLKFRPTPRITLFARLARFTVDDHAARIYTYENDVLYAFSSPSFSGRGRRSFVLLRLDLVRNMSLELKWSATIWEDINSVGSGRDEIQGNKSREIRVQVRWRLSE